MSRPSPTTPDAEAVLADAAGRGIQTVRISCVDQHGLLRTKTVDVARLASVLEAGVGLPGSLLAKDTANNYAVPLWSPSGLPTLDALLGAQDMVMVPDPATWRVLPWAERTGWLLCDLHHVGSCGRPGEPIALSTRGLCQRAVAALGHRGLGLRAGLELELHLFDATTGEPIHPGWELLGGRHAETIHNRVEPIRAGLVALGLPPRSVEVELGPGQVELSFEADDALATADQAVLVRHAVAALAERAGMRATFLCRPSAGAFPSGWHLHQSLVNERGANAFAVADSGAGPAGTGPGGTATPPDPEVGARALSATGRHWVGGLLAHAAASCLLTTPTVNGYKRYRPNSVAPDRISWSPQHRGAMVRLLGGGADPAIHVENRVGDPAANPYLYLASQLVSGLDGLAHQTEPSPPTLSPYTPDAGPLLPRSLGDAIDAFAGSELYRRCWGDEAVDYLVTIKTSEWRRFQAAVTDWELKEYGSLF
ncbi:MAG: glutamine synthetase family protein [Acidimicrobiia bacterium]|nr:glutamine synthetase family protein [Acidimicrobiia bacterium]